MQKRKMLIISISCILMYVLLNINLKQVTPVEHLDIPYGIGIDLESDKYGQLKYSVPIFISLYDEKQIKSNLIHLGEGNTLAATCEDRQTKSNKKFIMGLEKVFILSENFSKSGINPYIDLAFNNLTENDIALGAVCKGNSIDIFKFSKNRYPGKENYIDRMLKNTSNFNFFSDKYKLMNVFLNLSSEGHSLVLPYIEIFKDNLQITGLAIFKKDKMIKKLTLPESRILNMLRENNVTGIISLKKDFKKQLSFHCEAKHKIKCTKKNGKYTFNINLFLNGKITTNTLYNDLLSNPRIMEKVKNNISKKIIKQCNNFINKVQNNYKVDCLELGKYAAAKYGRQKGMDWNNAICKSNIHVTVKVNINKTSRGDY